MKSGKANKRGSKKGVAAACGQLDPVVGPLGEMLYPCYDCGKLRTKAEGGTTFTVCEKCWERHYGSSRT